MRRFIIIVLCLALGAPFPALGQTPLPELTPEQEDHFVKLVEQGSALYERGEFEASLKTYQRAHELYPHPDILYRLALCHERLGEDTQALQFYRLYLRELPPDSTERVKVERMIEPLVARAEKSQIRILTEPVGATVYIDGDTRPAADLTPATLGALPGNYEILVKKDGYEPVSELVTVTSGQSVTLSYQLKPLGASPGDADVKQGSKARPPSVGLVTFLVVGIGAGVTSAVLFSLHQEKRAELAEMEKNSRNYSRQQFDRVRTGSTIFLVTGISSAVISAGSLIAAYALWRSESSRARAGLGWAEGPVVTFGVDW